MQRLFLLFVLPVGLLAGSPGPVVSGEIRERHGLVRRATLVEQGIPIQPLPEPEARALRLSGAPGFVEPEARDEHGNVTWLRVAMLATMPAHGRTRVRIERGPATAAKIRLSASDSTIAVETSHYRLALNKPGGIELTAAGHTLLKGNWFVELVGDARAILWGTYLREFVPDSIEVEEHSDYRATLLMKARYTRNWRKQATVEEPGRRFDCELRLHVNALSPNIRFAWRITNLTGTKTWLQRYALRLPLGAGGDRLKVTAHFLEDLGRGAGVRRSQDGRHLLLGGLEMPPDGGYLAGKVPDIHRLFYEGMSRTFCGTLIPGGTAADAAEDLAPLDLVLPAQYYSDVKALPEAGDPVTFGEFETPIRRASEWLLKAQWRGTLFWGEWYREWDDTRNQGVQEASNGHSPLAPLYHYWRTGDACFLRCAERSAQYVWDVQLKKSGGGPGLMFHTRRHVFDELDWVHPRYQRATGGLVASHVFLNRAGRNAIIRTIRAFHDTIFRDGIPYDWDLRQNVLTASEDGPDVSNFMEALTWCWRETGDRYFLDAALRMSRWTIGLWHKQRESGKPWNWNCAQYVLRGLVNLYEASGDAEVRKAALEIASTTLSTATGPGQEVEHRTVVGDELHFVFYHSWISTRVAKFAADGDKMTATLLRVVRRELAHQRPDGQFSVEHGMESGLPTVWTSYYEAKSLVAFVPVLTAHVSATRRH